MAFLETHAGFCEHRSGQPAKEKEKCHAVHHRRDLVDPVLLGFVSGYTIGAFIHVLLVIAVVLLLVQFLSGRWT
jgi:hypothetical protein